MPHTGIGGSNLDLTWSALATQPGVKMKNMQGNNMQGDNMQGLNMQGW